MMQMCHCLGAKSAVSNVTTILIDITSFAFRDFSARSTYHCKNQLCIEYFPSLQTLLGKILNDRENRIFRNNLKSNISDNFFGVKGIPITHQYSIEPVIFTKRAYSLIPKIPCRSVNPP